MILMTKSILMDLTPPPPPVNEPFKGYVGIQFDTSGLEAIEFWDKFIQEYFLETIVTQTNLFTNQKLQSQQENLQPNSHLLKWKPLVFSKLSGFFFAFVIGMGLVGNSSLSEYWWTDSMNETPIFSKYMSKDRFLGILSKLHLVDNTQAIPTGRMGHDPLYKIRTFISVLNESFQTNYKPEMKFWLGHLPI